MTDTGLPSTPPHFVCIGAQKAGTQWFYDQAASHPDVWMPPLKEVRFFAPRAGTWPKARLKALAQLNWRLHHSWRGDKSDPRDIEFLRRMWFETTDESAGDLDIYRRLFSTAGDAITGDITPAYARLDRRRVAPLVAQLPDVPFLYFVRGPVSRVWSQVCMQVRWGLADSSILETEDILAAYLRTPGVAQHSFQSQTIDLWSEIAGDRFTVFAMGDLIAEPVEFRRRIFHHLGLDGDLCALPAGYNKKSSQPKVELPDNLRTVIEEFLGDEPQRLDRVLAELTVTSLG